MLLQLGTANIRSPWGACSILSGSSRELSWLLLCVIAITGVGCADRSGDDRYKGMTPPPLGSPLPVPAEKRVGRYAISCRIIDSHDRVVGFGPPMYSLLAIGKPGVPLLSPNQTAQAERILKMASRPDLRSYIQPENLRFAFPEGRGVPKEFVIFNASDDDICDFQHERSILNQGHEVYDPSNPSPYHAIMEHTNIIPVSPQP